MTGLRNALFTAIWFCLLSSLVTAPIAAQETLAQLYADAQQAERAGDYTAAIEKYRKIIALEPRMAEAHANLGKLQYQIGQTDQARASFARAIELKPGLAGPYFFLGVLSFQTNEFPAALKAFSQAERLEPQNVLVHMYLGYARTAMRNLAEAAEQFEKASSLESSNQDAFYHLSKTYSDLSEQYFEKLSQSFPNSAYTFLARAQVFEADQDWESASREYKKALAAAPRLTSLKARVAWVSKRAADGAAAPVENPPENDLTTGSLRFLYSPPSGPKIQEEMRSRQKNLRLLRSRSVNTAETNFALADGYKALSFLAAAWVAESNPGSFRAHQLKGESFEATGEDQQAIEEYRRAFELNPELPGVQFSIGNLYWKKNELEQALPALLGELKLNPNHAHALYETGDIYLSQEKPSQAKEHYERALKADPKIIEAHLALEKISTEAGDHQTSLEHLLKAAALAPADPTPRYRLSLLYKKMGKPEESRKEMALFMTLKAQKEKAEEGVREKKKRGL